MEVKIYREPENENLILDEESLNEYNSLAAELGLQSIEQSEKKNTPIVYPYLNTAMKVQLKVLCPVEVKIENYKKSTIPLEVLKVYKYAKDNEMFEEFFIWYDDSAPDPLLIAKRYDNEEDRAKGYSWSKSVYLLARWGDCAMELPSLLDKGKAQLKVNLELSAKSALSKVKDIIENPDKYVQEALNDRSISISILNSNGSLPF